MPADEGTVIEEPQDDTLQGSSRSWRKVVLSILVAVLAYSLVFRGTSLGAMGAAFRAIEEQWLAGSLALMALLQLLRLWRWGLLVRAVQPVSAGSVARIGSIGFMATDLFPLRLGEFVRPVLLDRRAGVPFGAGMATILVERFLDVLALLALLFATLALADLPTTLPQLGGWTIDLEAARGILLAAVLLLAVPVLGLLVAGDRAVALADRATGFLPGGLRAKVLALLESFVQALRAIGRPGTLTLAALLSGAAWLVSSGVAWLLLQAFGFDSFGPIEAAVVTLFVAVALMMPAPAGGVGVFEAGAAVALLFYGVDASNAAPYALALHGVHLGCITAIGLVCLGLEGISWKDLKR